MAAWGEQHGVGDKVLMPCDWKAAFTRSTGRLLHWSDLGLGERSKPWSMVGDNGVVATVNVGNGIPDAHAGGSADLLATVPA